MAQNLGSSLTDKAKNIITPLSKFGGIAIDNFEKVAQLQLSSAKFYADIGFDELESAAKIRNMQTINEFASHQVDVVDEINKKVTEDQHQLAGIGSKLKDDIGKLFSANGAGETKTDMLNKPLKDKKVVASSH